MADLLAKVDTPATVTTDKKLAKHVRPTGHDKETWTLQTDNASSKTGSEAGLVLRSVTDIRKRTKNEAKRIKPSTGME
ncbi:hypothetical protein Tco_0665295 [Tanacetum coccineum]